jgi:hypothetical protein
MDANLKALHDDLKQLRRTLKSEKTPQVSKKGLRQEAERLGQTWFSEIEPGLHQTASFSDDLIRKYSVGFQRLIKLSAPNNQRTSYLETVESLVKSMRDELIMPLQLTPSRSAPTVFESFVASLKDPEESGYFQEAINCAKHGFLRAAAVMAWCAAIDRIHHKIEGIGFTSFNVASAQMASQQKGRFKRFNQTQSITSLSELREVFDTIVLWVIEGMHLIDSNQHTRLRSCFEMRCQCAHPGEAPITEYNLMSHFSDIQQIVLENPNFSL